MNKNHSLKGKDKDRSQVENKFIILLNLSISRIQVRDQR